MLLRGTGLVCGLLGCAEQPGSLPWALRAVIPMDVFTVLGMCFFVCFLVFGSVHFYWGSAKSKAFRYHTKSRDDVQLCLIFRALPLHMLLQHPLRLFCSTSGCVDDREDAGSTMKGTNQRNVFLYVASYRVSLSHTLLHPITAPPLHPTLLHYPPLRFFCTEARFRCWSPFKSQPKEGSLWTIRAR